ncbi:MAG: MFS transporter, partial [Myxococcota bacterium]|nr:MFS transporter [Myxococcota bacterium]
MSNDSPTTPAHPELAETKPEPQRRHSLSVLLVVGIGTFLTALAGSTINLGLPELSREYEAGLVESRWVIQSFMLTVGVLLLIAGRAADIFGHRRLYLIGFSLFGVASLACGMAPSFSMLIVFRILQGVGSAMVMATGPALLTTNVPKSRRGQSLGLLSTATYLGLTAGPPLGGVLVAMGGWRWTFFLTV